MRLDTTMKQVIAGGVFAGVICFGVSFYVAREEAVLKTALTTKIESQATTLETLVDLIDRDGANEAVSKIVVDCNAVDRERFDYLLSNLQTLRGAELREVDLLFARCGGFYAERRSMMVAELQRELAVYQSYIELYSSIDGRAEAITYPTATWESIVALETTRANYMRELVAIQGEIISGLIGGAPVTGESIAALLQRAKETKENLSLAGVQRDTLRQELP
jgi:hypothetical protein